MTFLPIVARELRIAARLRTTFIIRSIVALIGIVVGGFQLLVLDLLAQAGGKGGMVFSFVTGYAFLIALLAGIFLASDCLSQERREGTLGFLFLTDLRSYDIVLGKFAAVSLNAFYGMLAIFPVLALCMLAGGVTGAEFGRACLALVNTLFFSVGAALWVSALSTSSYRAMAGSIALIVGVLSASALATGAAHFFPRLGPAVFVLSAISPLTSYINASTANYYYAASTFWSSLAVSNGFGWLFIALASWQMRYWREVDKTDGGWRRILAALVGASQRRKELLSINPVLWLLGNSRRLQWIAWSLAIVGGAIMLVISSNKSGVGIFMNVYVAWPAYFLLKILFAIQACRFFSESRRSGALELLCCTPLTRKSILSGQWMSLRRIFLWPIIVLILSQLACLCFLGNALASAMGPVNASVSTNMVVVNGSATPSPMAFVGWYPVFLIGKQIANSIADFFAIGWFGMWLALTLQKPGSSTGLTVLYVLVLPAILLCVPTLVTDVVFIVVGYSKLQQDFRTRVLARATGSPITAQELSGS